MSGFTFGGTSSTPTSGTLLPKFGTSTTTTSSTTGLFGSAPQSGNLFGGSTAPMSGSSATGLFGVSTVTTSSTSLFGSPAKTSVAGGLFGTSSTTSAPPVAGSFFGSTTSVGGGGLFGTSTTATSSAGLFGSTLLGTTATTSSAFAATAAGVPSSTATVGLGGGGVLTTTGFGGSLRSNGALGVAGSAASGSPMEGEVPQALLNIFNQLRERLKKNHELIDEYSMNGLDSCLKLEEKLDDLKKFRVEYADEVRIDKRKATDLLEKVQRDSHISEQIQRRQKEVAKNPHYGRKQAFEYLLANCSDYERLAVQYKTVLQSLEEALYARLGGGGKKVEITAQDLVEHFKRYDQIFKAVCAEVYQCNVQTQDLKEAFIDYRRKVSPYAPNPFEKQHNNVSLTEQSRFTGAEAFPSLVTMMKIGALARASTVTQPTTASSAFGTSGSLFGAKPFGSSGFPFASSTSSTAVAPLFKPFAVTTTASAPLFGSTGTSGVLAPLSVATTTTPFSFGNTLNSAVSGTLFGGSASKPFGK